MNIEVVSYTLTAPGAGGAAAAAVSGDSLTVKSARPGSKIKVLGWWIDSQGSGFSQLVFPSAHDTTRGIRIRHVASEVDNHLPLGFNQELQPQELLQITQSGSATAGDIENGSLLLYYEDNPGVQGNFIAWWSLNRRGLRVTTVEDTITPTTGGVYSGARALNAGSDLLKPNQEYAILGASIGAECCTLGIRSPDFGYTRVGIPGNDTDAWRTISWFTDLTTDTELPCIPVINSGNKASIFIDVLQDENLTAVPFALHLVQLAPK